jgi:hypothetical protein
MCGVVVPSLAAVNAAFLFPLFFGGLEMKKLGTRDEIWTMNVHERPVIECQASGVRPFLVTWG